MKHSQQRAEERFSIYFLKTDKVLLDIWAGRCELVESNQEKYSHIFLVRYQNKYIRVVTDFNVKFIKTVLPLKNDFELINKLIQKLNTSTVL